MALATQVTVISSWDDGYCALVQVTNETEATVSPWAVAVNTNATSLTTVWSGTGALEAGELTVGPAGHNAEIAAGASTEFGFCAAGATGEPEVTQATGESGSATPGNVTAELQLVNEWETGYCMNLTVTNAGDGNSASWEALVDLADGQIVDAWNTAYTVEGSTATLSSLSYNAVLAPGASTSAGFCGSKGESGELPTLVAGDDGTEDDGTGDDGTGDDGTEDDGTEDDGTEDDGTEDDGTEDDGTEDDGTEDDGTEDDGTEDDGTEDDGTEDDGTEDDGTEDDGTEDDGTEDDGTEDDGTEDDGTEDDGTEDDGPEDDGTEDDGTEDDGTEDDGTEDDGTEDDGTEDDGTEGQ